MTIVDDLAPYILTVILFMVAVLITRLFKVRDTRVILLSFAMLEFVFSAVSGTFGIGLAVLSIVLVALISHQKSGGQ